MISQDLQLKLQALLDNELSAAEAAEVNALLARDAAAQSLLAELRAAKSALAGNEPEVRLPEGREFFWSKIEKEIARQSAPAPAPRPVSWLAWLRPYLLPVSGFALLVCLAGILALNPRASSEQDEGIELASDEVGSYTFHDQEQGTTMVWLYNRNEDSPSAQPASADTVVQ
jgi:anti-sigma factor RsiW